MARLVRFFSVLFIFSLAFFSCKKDDDVIEEALSVTLSNTPLSTPIQYPDQDTITLVGGAKSSKGLTKIQYYSLEGSTETLVEEKALTGETEYDFSEKMFISDATTVLRVRCFDKANKVVTTDYAVSVVLASWTTTLGKSFTQAEGSGQNTTGGRFGKVLYVTNTADNTAPGSFRWAVNQTGRRTIVFKVSGTIPLGSAIEINNGNLTIAGQTAPGGGICLRDYPLRIKADNVIIRFMRFRLGNVYVGSVANDATEGQNHQNIIIDHCSASWSVDECASYYDNKNFTMQWCFITEGLRNAGHVKGAHGYGGIWGGQGVSFHHNLFAHNDSRNPRFCGARYTNRPDLEMVDFRNNVIYNWGSNSTYAGEGGSYNMINNYYKPGPATSTSAIRILQPYASDATTLETVGICGTFYLSGNYMDGSSTQASAINADNWAGVNLDNVTKTIVELGSSLTTAFSISTVTTQSAADAYTSVLAYAGASLSRDVVDTRIVGEVTTGTYTYNGKNTYDSYGNKVSVTYGLIDSQEDVGSWPALTTGTIPLDSDGDGMPDTWEVTHGLNKYNASDRNGTNLSNGSRTNLEYYLNSLVETLYP